MYLVICSEKEGMIQNIHNKKGMLGLIELRINVLNEELHQGVLLTRWVY